MAAPAGSVLRTSAVLQEGKGFWVASGFPTEDEGEQPRRLPARREALAPCPRAGQPSASPGRQPSPRVHSHREAELSLSFLCVNKAWPCSSLC